MKPRQEAGFKVCCTFVGAERAFFLSYLVVITIAAQLGLVLVLRACALKHRQIILLQCLAFAEQYSNAYYSSVSHDLLPPVPDHLKPARLLRCDDH